MELGVWPRAANVELPAHWLRRELDRGRCGGSAPAQGRAEGPTAQKIEEREESDAFAHKRQLRRNQSPVRRIPVWSGLCGCIWRRGLRMIIGLMLWFR